jgi:hypothetical protein
MKNNVLFHWVLANGKLKINVKFCNYVNAAVHSRYVSFLDLGYSCQQNYTCNSGTLTVNLSILRLH